VTDFAHAFAAHHATLVRSLCRSVDRDEAEDLAAATWLRVLERGLVPDLPLLRRIARGLMIDRWRTSRPTRSLDDADPAPECRDAAARLDLAVALASLPERDRRIVALRYGEGYSVTETATACALSSTAVKVAAHRALGRLRRAME
jgi:RNA polymerase sigma factor (sigma-70 family)